MKVGGISAISKFLRTWVRGGQAWRLIAFAALCSTVGAGLSLALLPSLGAAIAEGEDGKIVILAGMCIGTTRITILCASDSRLSNFAGTMFGITLSLVLSVALLYPVIGYHHRFRVLECLAVSLVVAVLSGCVEYVISRMNLDFFQWVSGSYSPIGSAPKPYEYLWPQYAVAAFCTFGFGYLFVDVIARGHGFRPLMILYICVVVLSAATTIVIDERREH